ncbi:cAMP-responsive element-binding protein-like 2 [Stegodyphus dumicola]|uniref:cAMP-responsive element-binding protein-like 2 n=1 Tax=Stegodyphus dumicola TaxID=202533 RepID=UPI0015AAB57D|nr:cAMP-responsive element-binding protein-like 2 [Stegodyphus dumicola]
MQAIENKHRDYAGKDKGSPDKEDRKEVRKGRKPGRKSSKIDMKAKLERSRQSARECRARKKIRYQYLDELVADREKAVLQLRKELEMYTQWARALDEGHIPEAALKMVEEEKRKEREKLLDRDINRQ